MTPSRRPGKATTSRAPDDSGLAAVPEPGRSGEDARRRGWFWHWNALVTQYAPLIGLKGVGLLNSYTVWTDRREESPHRGYAFPSQQSEADFYGEDRAELITINKILVALDLIEIRKEMVLASRPAGSALEGAPQLLPGERPRRRLHPLHPATSCASPSWPPGTALSTATCVASSPPASRRSTATTSGGAFCRKCGRARSGGSSRRAPP